MRNFFILLIFGIACSAVQAQIEESSINHSFGLIESNDFESDSILVWGDLSITFQLEDTLHFRGVHIEIDDDQGNPLKNEVFLKADLLSQRNLVGNQVSIGFGAMVSNITYIVRLVYMHIDETNADPIIYHINQ